MHEYWERRLEEARKINDQIEADLEVALAEVSPEAAEPVRAAIGGGVRAPARRRYAHADRRTTPLRIVAPSGPHRPQITIFPRERRTVPSATMDSAPALQVRGVEGTLWLRGLLAAISGLLSNAVLYAGLVASGATERISAAASLPATFAITSVLVAATGAVAFRSLRLWIRRPDAAFRLLAAAAVVALLVSFIVTPGATFLAAIVAVVMTSVSLGSEPRSD